MEVVGGQWEFSKLNHHQAFWDAIRTAQNIAV
jgi:hypothetical protein